MASAALSVVEHATLPDASRGREHETRDDRHCESDPGGCQTAGEPERHDGSTSPAPNLTQAFAHERRFVQR
ncbi:hypothetical protein BKD30_01905 [Tersicoccus phoenicis]|uniref:Uncharacterized protein n=1 Tax=Tersicoccus phoenicis TaxID=554083 RepID=A0A1R1LL60_9MICC|nr:hypothetical protein BKD30_01905 [Tersicoccus phoenicis]